MDGLLALIDKRFDDNTKRFDDVKWYITGISSIFTVIFGVIVLVSGWNYSTERSSLRDFEKEIKDRYAHIGDSKITLYGINGIDLSGQELPVTVFEAPKQNPSEGPSLEGRYWGMNFNFIVKNSSDVDSGYVYYKILVNHPLITPTPSGDDPKYDYEYQISPSTTYFNLLPGHYSGTVILTLYVLSEKIPKPGKYPAIIKVYYGSGQISSAAISFVVK